MTNVAAVVINFNTLELTRRCLAALKKSELSVQVVVVDNGSSEPGIETLPRCFPTLALLRSPRNLGFGGANNLALRWILKETECEYALLLNSDAFVHPEAIGHLRCTLDQNPGAGAACPRIVFSESPHTLYYGGGEVNWWTGSASVPGYGLASDTAYALEKKIVSFATGCAVLLRRSVIETVGGFDTRFFMYEEDVELGLRIQEAGWTIRYVPDALVYHRGQGTQRAEGEPFRTIQSPTNPRLPFFAYHTTKNRLLNMNMHAHGWNRLRFGAGFPLFLGQRAVQYLRHGRTDGVRALFQGVVAAWSERGQAGYTDLLQDR